MPSLNGATLCVLLLIAGSRAWAQPADQAVGNADALIIALRPSVDAAYAFRREHGLWPMSLEGFAPALNQDASQTLEYRWNPEGESVLFLNSNAHAGPIAAHVFGGYDAGWHVKRNKRFVRIEAPVPDVGAARFTPEMVRLASREYDRRIAEEPSVQLHHRCKVSLLYLAQGYDSAAEAAVQWCRAFPDEMDARLALLTIERKRGSGLDIRSVFPDEWQEYPHPTFAAWSLYNDPFSSTGPRAAMGVALELPFAVNDAEWLIADACAYNAATIYLYGASEHPLAICERWRSESQRLSQDLHPAFDLVRAATFAKLGRFEEATAALDKSPSFKNEEFQSARREIQRRIANRESGGFLDLPALNSQGRWLLDPE